MEAHAIEQHNAVSRGLELIEKLPRLSFGINSIDDALNGGLSIGSVSEWGMPHGKGGRELISALLAHNHALSLWVSQDAEHLPYAPAWQNRGVDLERCYFCHSDEPLTQLRPIFLEPLFRIIVLDLKRPLTRDELAFCAHRARKNKQCILILRDFFLGPKGTRPWFRMRANCWQRPDSNAQGKWKLNVIKGARPQSISFQV